MAAPVEGEDAASRARELLRDEVPGARVLLETVQQQNGITGGTGRRPVGEVEPDPARIDVEVARRGGDVRLRRCGARQAGVPRNQRAGFSSVIVVIAASGTPASRSIGMTRSKRCVGVQSGSMVGMFDGSST